MSMEGGGEEFDEHPMRIAPASSAMAPPSRIQRVENPGCCCIMFMTARASRHGGRARELSSSVAIVCCRVHPCSLAIEPKNPHFGPIPVQLSAPPFAPARGD
jgi:hypothetical protein